jgi:hypothetical protein
VATSRATGGVIAPNNIDICDRHRGRRKGRRKEPRKGKSRRDEAAGKIAFGERFVIQLPMLVTLPSALPSAERFVHIVKGAAALAAQHKKGRR